MTTKRHHKKYSPAMENPVELPCGCVNLIGGPITFCPMHAAAPEMLDFIRTISGVPYPPEGMTETQACVTFAMLVTDTARSILARITPHPATARQ